MSASCVSTICSSYVERTFRHVAEAKSVGFVIRWISACRSRCITDAKRLQQIIKNLLSNAFKFTHQGQVTLTVEPVAGRLEPGQRGAEPRPRGAGVLGVRHRHRHPAGQAADHLRGVPAGRRQHQPQVRRHRPGPGHQPRAVAAARRRDPAGRPAPAAAARSPCTCRRSTRRRVPPQGGRRRRRTRAATVRPRSPASWTSAAGRLAGASRNGALARADARRGLARSRGRRPRQRGRATTATPSSPATACC